MDKRIRLKIKGRFRFFTSEQKAKTAALKNRIKTGLEIYTINKDGVNLEIKQMRNGVWETVSKTFTPSLGKIEKTEKPLTKTSYKKAMKEFGELFQAEKGTAESKRADVLSGLILEYENKLTRKKND